MHVTGIGQCSWDYLGVMDSYPSVDTKTEIHDWQEQGGGPVATALVALARLGVSCSFHGIAGECGGNTHHGVKLQRRGPVAQLFRGVQGNFTIDRSGGQGSGAPPPPVADV